MGKPFFFGGKRSLLRLPRGEKAERLMNLSERERATHRGVALIAASDEKKQLRSYHQVPQI